jgi:hypothetical protein
MGYGLDEFLRVSHYPVGGGTNEELLAGPSW